MSALADALRTRYRSPQAALRALGLDETLVGGNTMPRRPSQRRPGFDEDPEMDPEQTSIDPDMVIPCEQALDIVAKLILRIAPQQKEMFLRNLQELVMAQPEAQSEEGPVADEYNSEEDQYRQPSGPDHIHDLLTGTAYTRPSTAPALGRRQAMDSRAPLAARLGVTFPEVADRARPRPKPLRSREERIRASADASDFLTRFPMLRGR